jgi:hypothetical protein
MLLLSLGACMEEPEDLSQVSKLPPQLAQVKQWFEANKEQLRIRDGGASFRTESQELIMPFFEKEPDWERVHQYSFADGRDVYEVNVGNGSLIYPVDFDSLQPHVSAIQNILFVENKEKKSFDPVIIRYLPSDLQSIKEFGEISYGKIGAGWSGRIDVWTYDEHHYIGFNVKNGVLETTSKLKRALDHGTRIGYESSYVADDCVIRPRWVTYTVTMMSPRYIGVPHSVTTYVELEGWDEICFPAGGTGVNINGNYSFEGGGGGGSACFDGSSNFWASYQPPSIPEPGLITPNQMIYSVLSPFEKSWWDNVATDEYKTLLQNFLYSPQGNYDLAWEIVSLSVKEETTSSAETLSELVIDTYRSGYFENSLDGGFPLLISPKYVNFNVQTLGGRYSSYILMECAILKREHPDWSDVHVYWEASKAMLQLALDIGGLVPGIGEVCDLTNAGIYAVTGDTFNAGLSLASAIPIAGWYASGYKYAIKAVDLSSQSKTILKWIVKQDGSIIFGSRDQLRKVLGIVSSNQQAHHLIPWEMAGHPLVQKAAKSGDAFHMNEVINGIAVPTSNHLKGHNLYNQKVAQILNGLDSPTISNQIAHDRITDFADYLKNLIQQNPNLNMGQISNLITYP